MVAAAPGAKFCGPDTNPNPAWCKSLASEFATSGRFTMITQHDYPGGCAYKNPNVADIKDLIPNDPAMAREKMLSTAWVASYEKVQKGMADAVAGTGIGFRMTETNNLWFGGLEGASDSYAAALWSADYLFWWAAHGARGLNFHTGDMVGGGDKTLPSRYAAFVTAGGGYDVRPLSYGMKFFTLGGQGRMVATTWGREKIDDVDVYASKETDGKVWVSLINRSHGASAAEREIRLDFASSVKAARVIYLAAKGGDIAAKDGVTLGGEAIQTDGGWKGNWKDAQVEGDHVMVRVPGASGVVVEVNADAK
jgi:hypothetical protein